MLLFLYFFHNLWLFNLYGIKSRTSSSNRCTNAIITEEAIVVDQRALRREAGSRYNPSSVVSAAFGLADLPHLWRQLIGRAPCSVEVGRFIGRPASSAPRGVTATLKMPHPHKYWGRLVSVPLPGNLSPPHFGAPPHAGRTVFPQGPVPP